MYTRIQDLSSSKSIIKNELRKRHSLFSIYRKLRSNKRDYSNIGDYPLLNYIVNVAKSEGKKIDKKSVLKIMKKTEDREFLTVRLDAEILRQICG